MSKSLSKPPRTVLAKPAGGLSANLATGRGIPAMTAVRLPAGAPAAPGMAGRAPGRGIPARVCAQAPGGCPCSLRTRGAGPRYGTASQYGHRHLGVAVQLSVDGGSVELAKPAGGRSACRAPGRGNPAKACCATSGGCPCSSAKGPQGRSTKGGKEGNHERQAEGGRGVWGGRPQKDTRGGRRGGRASRRSHKEPRTGAGPQHNNCPRVRM